MRSNFTTIQLDDPHIAAAERNLRTCVHCGICTATCPTYILTGDERDGPRGRIVMMQAMLEQGGAPTAETVRHLDRCLSCLGCRSACPSNVDYAQLIDTARAHIHTHYKRPLRDRLSRATIAFVMPRPGLVKFAVMLARVFAPITTRIPGVFGSMARKATNVSRQTNNTPLPETPHHRRVGLMPGCVQQALAPEIDRAASRVFARRGIALAKMEGAGCCGALAHHLGHRDEAKSWAKRAIEAFERTGDIEAVLITATGCASHLADYPQLLDDEPAWRDRAEAFASKVRDFSELVEPQPRPAKNMRVAHHIPCSLQHGLKRADYGAPALAAAGYEVLDIPDGHLCCGSAGSYSLLQPGMADALRRRKLDSIGALNVDAVASSNIGCLSHLSGPDAPPIIHPAELIDWAEGGPPPAALSASKNAVAAKRSR